MNAPAIPRKAVAEPSPVYMKEIDSHVTNSDSGWEIPEAGHAKRSHHVGRGSAARWAISDRLDRILPPHKRYFGRSRRTLFIAILALFLCILALIIGLAVGLSHGSKKYHFLSISSSLTLTHGPGLKTFPCPLAPKRILVT